ncbi:hypothetical protein [Veillonella sp.]|uniref:hypothetical protein n=1 Tax=Veillonella sp. TaxID=1926307 RepID=UPI0025E3078D|nr:hypothetical protein [Veillonella sp.]
MAKTEITKKKIEEEVKKIVTNDIYARVDSFMNDVINAHYEGVKIESVDMDALDFAMLVDSDPDEYGDYEYSEVCEWWLISPWLARYMKEIGGYVVCEVADGYVWGRQGTNYAVADDMEHIAKYFLEKMNK